MISFAMRLTCLNQVGAFVKAADTLPCDIMVKSGAYSVNGKSLMGILSLGTAEPMTVEVYGTEQEAETLKDSVKPYIVAS